jgi:hypothetical protein
VLILFLELLLQKVAATVEHLLQYQVEMAVVVEAEVPALLELVQGMVFILALLI